MLRHNRICSIEYINGLLDHGLLLGLAGQGVGGGADDHGLGSKDSPTFAGETITGNSVLGLNSAIFQPVTDSTTFFQVLDAAGTPVFNVDTTNSNVGFGTDSIPTNANVVISSPVSPAESVFLYFQNFSTKYTNFDGSRIGITNSKNIEIRNFEPFDIRFFTSNDEIVRFHASGGVSIGDTFVGSDPGVDSLIVEGSFGIGEIAPETPIELTHATPYITLHNSTHEDTDGGGESRLIFKREDGAGTETAAGQIEISHDGSVANDQLGKMIFSVNTGAGLAQALEIGSDLLVTSSGAFRGATSLWWRIQHVDLASTPALGAVGATYTPQSVNNLNGYQLDNTPAEEYLNFNTHVGTDWDEASDLELVVQFETNVDNSAGDVTDTVDFDLVMYYKGAGETAQKTQDLNASVVVGQAAQYYHEQVMFTIDHDLVNHVVQIGDCVSFALHLNDDTPLTQVINVIAHHAMFRYKTKKVRAEV